MTTEAILKKDYVSESKFTGLIAMLNVRNLVSEVLSMEYQKDRQFQDWLIS